MGSHFADNTWFEIETCCKCHIKFAMPIELRDRRIEDHLSFYCPSGHAQHYTGPSEKEKLKKELESQRQMLERQRQILESAQARANTAEAERQQIAKAHQKMRVRVMNGVCPCCNRTFTNLMNHMHTEHPEFSKTQTLLTLRNAFGMTQAAVARDAGVDTTHVSLYEREKHVAAYVKRSLDAWVEKHKEAGALEAMK